MSTLNQTVPTRTVIAYGAGQLGAQIFRDTPAVLLPLFMTTMLGVPAWMAGFVVLIPKLWLILCDPLVGAWSDRLKPRFGRTPFLIGGAIATAAGFLTLFAVTRYGSPLLGAAATCALFFIGSTAFSIYSVPYLAVAAELSRDPHQRTRIMVLRMVFATFGVLAGVGLAQPLIAWGGGGASGWHLMSLVLGAVCLTSMLVTGLGLRGVALIPGEAGSIGLLGQFSQVKANRPYLTLLGASFVQNMAQASSYTVMGFVFIYAIQAVWLIPLFILVMSAAGLSSQPFWLWASRRYGKAACWRGASFVWALLTVTWFWVNPGDKPLVGPLNLQHLLVLLRAAVIGVVNSGFILLALSMMTDTVDDQRRRTGTANEGVFAGVYSALEKLAFALGPVIAGLVMSGFGFVASTGGITAQSTSAVTGILLLYSLIPAALQMVSLALFTSYRLGSATTPVLMEA
ncbi:MFS transporter [Novosphingobium rosa]|uniref:MFS transporter n=1 Tax=Novosphingobium rosa TaxID=76978 RepID=UPI00083507FF|nr:MFS transporter [Novosphingobium rosa]